MLADLAECKKKLVDLEAQLKESESAQQNIVVPADSTH